jgi:hypothetical protein
VGEFKSQRHILFVERNKNGTLIELNGTVIE